MTDILCCLSAFNHAAVQLTSESAVMCTIMSGTLHLLYTQQGHTTLTVVNIETCDLCETAAAW